MAVNSAAGATIASGTPIRWTAPVDIAAGGGHRGPWRQNASQFDFVDDPTVALRPGGAATVAWVDHRRKDVLFQIYGADGEPHLAEPVNVSRSAEVFSWLPRIALAPGHPEDVYVLWQEILFTGGSHGGEIFFARSHDGGRRFSTPVNLSNTQGGAGKGRINKEVWHNGSLDLAVGQGGTLYAAWTEYDGPLLFSRSDSRGARFSTPIRIAGDRGTPARAPALAVGPDRAIYLAWTVGEHADADIHIARSTDDGRTFSAPALVARTRGYSDAPKLAVDRRGTLHVVYAESTGGPFERSQVLYTRSGDGGRLFEPAREISSPHPHRGASAAFPALGLNDNDQVVVLWELFPDPRQRPRGLALAHSADGGQMFSAPAHVPGSSDRGGGTNGSQQGFLMRKLAVSSSGSIAVVNSSFKAQGKSRVWLMRGQLLAPRR